MSQATTICLVASFEQNAHFEMALVHLEQIGIPRSRLFAVPLESRSMPPQFFDTINRSDGRSLFDGAAALGTVMMVLGSIYGFQLKWGPILWGIIGLFIGGLIGFGLDYLWTRSQQVKQLKKPMTEVVLLLYCRQDEVDVSLRVLWQQGALGVARLDRSQDAFCRDSAHSEK